jgi:hypothetical protein
MRLVRTLPTPLMHRGLLPQVSCRHATLAGPERTSGRTLWATHQSSRHRAICPRTKIRLGARAPLPSPHHPQPARRWSRCADPGPCPGCPNPATASPASRSFVLAALRALHLDPGLRPIAPGHQRGAALPSTRTLIDQGSPHR